MACRKFILDEIRGNWNVKNYVCLNAGQKTGIYIENYQIIIVFGLAVTLISTTT